MPTRRPASTELEPSEPDRAPDLIGAYERRTSNTNHVPFASPPPRSSGHPVRVRLASAPECGVAGGGDGCHARAALPRSGTRGWLGDHIMGGTGASHLYILRLDAASGVMPLGLSAMYTAQAAGRRTSTQHGTKQRRISIRAQERRDSGNVAVVIATQKGAVRALDGRKEERPQFATVLLRRWAVTTRRARCTRCDSALTSHVARVAAIGPCPRCAVWERGAVLFFVRR